MTKASNTRFIIRGILVTALMSALAWGQEERTPGARRSADDLTLGVKIGEPGRIQSPVMVNWKLSNGLQVLVGPNPGQPLITGTLLIRAGTLFDPPDRVGLTEAVSRVLMYGGSRKQDGAQMLKKLNRWGATISIQADVSEMKVSFSCLGEHLKPVLELVAGLMREPGFPVEAIERAQAELRNGIAQRNQDPDVVARRVFQEALIGENARRRPHLEFADVDLIQIEDLQRFQETYLRPGGAQLALTGDLDPAAVREMVEGHFGSWQSRTGPPLTPRTQDQQAVRAVLLANTPDSEKAILLAGHKGLRLADPDYVPALVAAQVLRQRIEKAIQHNDLWASWRLSFQVVLKAHPLEEGALLISGTSSMGSASHAVSFVQNQIPELLKPLVTEKELSDARQSARRMLETTVAQEQDLFDYCAWLRFYGVRGSEDPLARWQAELAALTKGVVEKAMKKHVRPGEFSVVVAGHKESFFPPLTGAREVDLSIAPTKAVEATVSEEGRRQGLLWLARMQRAMGGHEALGSVKDFKAEYIGEMREGGPVKLRESWMADNILRQDQEIAGQSTSIFYDGKIGWIGQGRRVVPLSEFALDQVRGAIFRHPFLLALRGNQKTETVNYLGAGTVELTGEHEQWTRVQLDEETGLPKKTSYRMRTSSGALLSSEDVFSDWREERGVKWPGRILTLRGGSESSDLRLLTIEWNTGLTQAEIEKKP